MENIPHFTNMIGISEKFIKTEYPNYYLEIYNEVKEINISIYERIWLYQHNMEYKPICNVCKLNTLKYKNFNKGYYKYCSKTCAAIDTHQNKEIKDKRISKILKCNYDDTIRKNMTIKSINTKKNFSKRKIENINKKRINTCILKYGIDNVSKNPELNIRKKEKIKKRLLISNKNKLINKVKDYGFEFIKTENNDIYLYSNKCKHEFRINKYLINQRYRFDVNICTICNPVNHNNSDFQQKVYNFIKSIYNGNIEFNKKFSKYELDIFLPDISIGFECNGLYWHSELYKEKNYHIDKYNFFKEKDIRIINIWEDWWKYKYDIICSIIKNILGITNIKIYARNCYIEEIKDKSLIKEFLNKNHLQGNINSKINIGLFKNKELLSIMSFSNGRLALGKKYESKDKWEIIRFCNKLDTNIIGGASKLLNFFIKNYSPKIIYTYADKSISNGNLYEKLNMEFIKDTEPNYYYFNKDIGIRLYRFNFRKDMLVKQGYDPNKTESNIMKERGFFRIYDIGNLLYEKIIL